LNYINLYDCASWGVEDNRGLFSSAKTTPCFCHPLITLVREVYLVVKKKEEERRKKKKKKKKHPLPPPSLTSFFSNRLCLCNKQQQQDNHRDVFPQFSLTLCLWRFRQLGPVRGRI